MNSQPPVSKIAANRHNVSVILGSQWGDEGKGKIVDLLSSQAEVVCRFQGGNNAGHTVVVDEVSYDFHLLPCGIINKNSISVIGNGVVVNLPQLFDELERNHLLSTNIKSNGTGDKQQNHSSEAEWMDRLYISNEAHLVFDVHQKADGLIEADLQADGKRQIGTTKKGIGPTYSTKALRMGIRMEELVDNFELFEKEFRHLVDYHKKQFNNPAQLLDTDKELEKYKLLADRIRPCVRDTRKFLNDSIKAGKKVLIEGANGSMLDIDHGTYPYVTSSNCTIGGVCTGLGLPTTAIGSIYGVVKAYCTRVGDGPFPTELHDDKGDELQSLGHEIGVTTKRKRRCGWLDCVLLNYTNMLNDYSALALTKLDVLSTLDEIKIAKAYKLDGKLLDSPPTNANKLSRVEVVYETFPGWKKDISKVRRFEDLPKEAVQYVKFIEDFVEVPVKWIGVGQDRDAIIQVF
uniref:Adenylosuccinate synthetase n=1 Tax=Aceria tosichella TaxID=561515 RepID=A0A6G1SMF9_9ACAR